MKHDGMDLDKKKKNLGPLNKSYNEEVPMDDFPVACSICAHSSTHIIQSNMIGSGEQRILDLYEYIPLSVMYIQVLHSHI